MSKTNITAGLNAGKGSYEDMNGFKQTRRQVPYRGNTFTRVVLAERPGVVFTPSLSAREKDREEGQVYFGRRQNCLVCRDVQEHVQATYKIQILPS